MWIKLFRVKTNKNTKKKQKKRKNISYAQNYQQNVNNLK